MDFRITVKQTITRHPSISFSKEKLNGNLEDLLLEIKNHPTIEDLDLQDLEKFLEERGFDIDCFVEDDGELEGWEVVELKEIEPNECYNTINRDTMKVRCRVGNIKLTYDYENKPNAIYVELEKESIWEEFNTGESYADIVYKYLGHCSAAIDFIMDIADMRANK